ncbi:MAG: DEAD/DEAH box helicase, partial [Planctomycetota bacterium]
VQQQAVPVILQGRDLVASAETGSGKTAAFLLPIIQRLLENKNRGSTRALILVPTRELANQVRSVAIDLTVGTRIRCAAVYGGVGMGDQVRNLRKGTDIIVATPGRLLDHVGRGNVRFRDLQFLGLDEADRMLDMGFMPDIRRILDTLPGNRQTLLLSATIPPAIAKLAAEILDDPVRVRIGNPGRATVPTGITHSVYPVNTKRKSDLLKRLLEKGSMSSVVVFCRTKHRADRLAKTLTAAGFSSGVMHGDRSQAQRERALASFRSGRKNVLVATDVAARGLDVDGVSHVVNFDFPRVPEDYIHRVGRTARAENRGDAISLVAPEERNGLIDVEREIKRRIERVKLQDFDYGHEEPVHRPRTSTNGKHHKNGKKKGPRGRFAGASAGSGTERPSGNRLWKRGRKKSRRLAGRGK